MKRFWLSSVSALSGHSCSVSFSWGQTWFSNSYIILSIEHISQRNSDKTEAAGQGILEFCLLKIWEFVGRGFFIFSRISFKQHGSVFMCYTNIYAPILPVYAKVSHTGDLYTWCVCSFVSHGMIPEKKKKNSFYSRTTNLNIFNALCLYWEENFRLQDF